MMFGRGLRFEYRECLECKSLWLADELTAKDLETYYGDEYYSYAKRYDSGLFAWLLKQRDRSELGDWNPIGSAMAYKRPNSTVQMLATLKLPRSAHIIDVGCGGGWLLDRLAVKFTNLMGIDPYVAGDQTSSVGVPIRKGYLTDLVETFDLVMFHHALEHTADPVAELAVVRKHLRPGGRCLIRIPTVSSEAWDRYGVDWVQLDAPRHLAIPSREGMARAVAAAGLRVIDTIDDSTAFQFEGSERYRAGVPLVNGIFDVAPARRAQFERESKRLNAQGRGDQAGFVLAV
ncbi:class I SAM-dependent methyltransferase [uncultured Sphingomonas sp.]|uniref:class I SAM-dependent methyltransferase n=1 Tax=uncultured Sphingomonas sp. TaxID=158754 RepID=UPI0035CA953B